MTITESFPAALRQRLEALGFSFHIGDATVADLAGKHWWCWLGPDNAWGEVETGAPQEDDLHALLDALDNYTMFMCDVRNAILDHAPDDQPDAEDYDDTESAESKGEEVAWFEAARIVREGV